MYPMRRNPNHNSTRTHNNCKRKSLTILLSQNSRSVECEIKIHVSCSIDLGLLSAVGIGPGSTTVEVLRFNYGREYGQSNCVSFV